MARGRADVGSTPIARHSINEACTAPRLLSTPETAFYLRRSLQAYQLQHFTHPLPVSTEPNTTSMISMISTFLKSKYEYVTYLMYQKGFGRVVCSCLLGPSGHTGAGTHNSTKPLLRHKIDSFQCPPQVPLWLAPVPSEKRGQARVQPQES